MGFLQIMFLHDNNRVLIQCLYSVQIEIVTHISDKHAKKMSYDLLLLEMDMNYTDIYNIQQIKAQRQ